MDFPISRDMNGMTPFRMLHVNSHEVDYISRICLLNITCVYVKPEMKSSKSRDCVFSFFSFFRRLPFCNNIDVITINIII